MLEISLEVQLDWLRRFLPEARSVGVVYNPAENGARALEVQRAASAAGFTVEARAVERPQDLPRALDSLSNRADVLLGLTEGVVLTPQTAKNGLLFSFRNRIPFVGLS